MSVEKPLTSELEPQAVIGAVQSRIREIQESRRQVRETELDRERAIQASIEQGRISLLIGSISQAKTRRIRIFSNGPYSPLNVGFAKVWQNDPPKEEIPLYDAKPWDIKILPQTNIDRLEDVAACLGAFIQNYYPQAAHIPIWIHTHPRAHSRGNKPEITFTQL